ncbi:MAG: hypothetical protein C4306_11935 [Thermoleophilia bacterium]
MCECGRESVVLQCLGTELERELTELLDGCLDQLPGSIRLDVGVALAGAQGQERAGRRLGALVVQGEGERAAPLLFGVDELA